MCAAAGARLYIDHLGLFAGPAERSAAESHFAAHAFDQFADVHCGLLDLLHWFGSVGHLDWPGAAFEDATVGPARRTRDYHLRPSSTRNFQNQFSVPGQAVS